MGFFKNVNLETITYQDIKSLICADSFNKLMGDHIGRMRAMDVPERHVHIKDRDKLSEHHKACLDYNIYLTDQKCEIEVEFKYILEGAGSARAMHTEKARSRYDITKLWNIISEHDLKKSHIWAIQVSPYYSATSSILNRKDPSIMNVTIYFRDRPVNDDPFQDGLDTIRTSLYPME